MNNKGKKQYSCWCHTRNSSRIFWSQFIGGIKIILCCCCKILYRILHNESVQFACQLPNLNKLVMSSRGWMNALLSSWQGVMGRASKTGCCYLCIYSKDEAAKSHIKILTNTFSRRPTEWNGLSDLGGISNWVPTCKIMLVSIRICHHIVKSFLWCMILGYTCICYVSYIGIRIFASENQLLAWCSHSPLLSFSRSFPPPLIIIIIII